MFMCVLLEAFLRKYLFHKSQLLSSSTPTFRPNMNNSFDLCILILCAKLTALPNSGTKPNWEKLTCNHAPTSAKKRSQAPWNQAAPPPTAGRLRARTSTVRWLTRERTISFPIAKRWSQNNFFSPSFFRSVGGAAIATIIKTAFQRPGIIFPVDSKAKDRQWRQLILTADISSGREQASFACQDGERGIGVFVRLSQRS